MFSITWDMAVTVLSMTFEDSIRFLDHEAAQCRGRDACEALCLLLPALMRVLDLERMEDVEAAAFKFKLKRALENHPARAQILKPLEKGPAKTFAHSR